MSAFAYIKSAVIPSALLMLPTKMDSPEARAMLLAIGLQESNFVWRRQIGGPARSFWGFELGGLRGVLTHIATRPLIEPLLGEIRYGLTTELSYTAIEHNDVLACVYARLLLWTGPRPLPAKSEANEGWAQYMDLWRPGTPRRATWNGYFEQAWS